MRLRDRNELRGVTLHFRRDGFEIEAPGGRTLRAKHARFEQSTLSVELDGTHVRVTAVIDGSDITVFHGGRPWRLSVDDPTVHAAEQASGSGKLTAPMPCAIVVVHVKPGQDVEKNQALLVLEAMKMEHTVRAPSAGRVEARARRRG